MDEKRLGKIVGEGIMEYPELDIYGQTYTRPCTTIRVGGGFFVVVPANFSDTSTLDAIKAELATPTVLNPVVQIGKKVVKPNDEQPAS